MNKKLLITAIAGLLAGRGLTADVPDCQSILDNLDAASAQMTQSAVDIQASIDAANAHKANFQTKLTDFKNRATCIDRRHSQLITAYVQHVTAQTDTITDLQAQLNAKTAELASVEAALKAKTAEAEQCAADLANLQAVSDQCLIDASGRITTLMGEYTALVAKRNELTAAVAGLQAAFNTAADPVASLLANVKSDIEQHVADAQATGVDVSGVLPCDVENPGN